MHFSGSGYTGLHGVVEFSTGSGASVLLVVRGEEVVLVTSLNRELVMLSDRGDMSTVTRLGPEINVPVCCLLVTHNVPYHQSSAIDHNFHKFFRAISSQEYIC